MSPCGKKPCGTMKAKKVKKTTKKAAPKKK